MTNHVHIIAIPKNQDSLQTKFIEEKTRTGKSCGDDSVNITQLRHRSDKHSDTLRLRYFQQRL